MINEFIGSIAETVKGLMPNVTIYSEQVPQNLKTPCCYIHCINHNRQLMTAGKRKLFTYEVLFLPTENSLSSNEEVNNAIELLIEGLGIVEHKEQKYKATDVKTEITDSEAHYIASYNYNTLNEGGVKMRTLKIEQESD